ncbi:MAG: hypothetical protein NTY46_11345 [Candidatus Sumerlaeota bacterium]|nr:hypothetical protein [Candidatus Sumerlaeota bacterium]
MLTARGRITLFVALVAFFFLGLYTIRPALWRLSHVLPDNYRNIAAQAAAAGDFGTAEKIARRRLETAFYDFDAHYILADTLARQNKPAEAALVIKDVMTRLPGARSKRALGAGYDEARTLCLLAGYLWDAGLFFEAGEMGRAALDATTPRMAAQLAAKMTADNPNPRARLAAARIALKNRDKTLFDRQLSPLEQGNDDAAAQAVLLRAAWQEHRDASTTAAEVVLRNATQRFPGQPALKLALAGLLDRTGQTTESQTLIDEIGTTTGTRTAGPGLFQLPPTAVLMPGSDGILLRNNSVASVQFNTGVFRNTSLLAAMRGSAALGLFPIVIVKSGETELTRLYIDDPQPRIYDIAFWPDGAPKLLDLRFQFINDAYDPYSKEDRNVVISNVMTH